MRESVKLIDDCLDPDWMEIVWEVIATHTNSAETKKGGYRDDQWWKKWRYELTNPIMSTVKGALNLASQLAEFADFWSCELPRQSLVSDILVGMNLKSQNRSNALDFRDKRSNATEWYAVYALHVTLLHCFRGDAFTFLVNQHWPCLDSGLFYCAPGYCVHKKSRLHKK